MRLDALQAAARLQAAQTNLQTYSSELIANARKALDETRFGFQEGRSNILAVLEAERTYRTLAGERANALSAYTQSLAELDRAVGRTPPDLLASLERDFGRKDITQVKTVDVDASANLLMPNTSVPMQPNNTNPASGNNPGTIPAASPTPATSPASKGNKGQK